MTSGKIELTQVVVDPVKDEVKKARRWPQIIAALGSNMGAFAYGLTLAWSVTAVPSLKKDPQFLDLTKSQLTWITSVITLGALAICLPTGILVDWIGRRRIMLVFSVIYIGGYLLLYFAWNVFMIIGGRFISGVCCGVFVFVSPIFIAETSDPDIRGTLLSSYAYMASLGTLFQLITGHALPWRLQSLIGAGMGLIIPVVMWLVPESPRFLLFKGKMTQARASIVWFSPNDSPDQNTIQLAAMNQNIQEERKLHSKNPLEQFSKPEIRAAIGIGFMLLFCRIFTGVIAIFFYRLEIFESAQVDFDENTSSIILGVVDLVGSLVATGVVDKFERKSLMIFSEIIMFFSLISLGGFFHVQKLDPMFARIQLGWLPLTSLVIFEFAFCIGMSTIPSTIFTEILPQRVRGTASSLLTVVRWSITFMMAHFFNDLVHILGRDGIYWFFACCCLLGGVYMAYFIPKTKGKTLEEIQEQLMLKNKKVAN